MSSPRLFGFHARPGRLGPVLTVVPFVLLAAAYLYGSHMRLEINHSDKLMPSPADMWQSFVQVAFEHDRRTGELLLLTDWTSSMWRLLIGVGAAAAVGLLAGLNAGLFPGFDRLISPFVTVISIIPPLALLPILFVTFGVDEVGKVILIFFGLVWTITRDIRQYVGSIPGEQIVKGLTLGGTQLRIAYGILLPQVWPRLISAVRLNLGSAWLFLIASEAIASESGLGYRIFLVRRYMAMDVILPYVAVITLTGFAMDWLLAFANRKLFPWYEAPGGDD
jgi:NitT/TauT family transport system permease protein